MGCPPTRSQEWLEAHEAEFVGLGVDDAVALIEGAGLEARVIPYGAWETQAMGRFRVTLHLTADGGLAAVDAG